MRKSTRNVYFPPYFVDQEASQGLSPGSWRNGTIKIQRLINLRAQGFKTLQKLQKEVRNDSKDDFNLEHGKRSWHREIVQSTASLFDEIS